MLEGGTTTVTPSNLCVLMSMVAQPQSPYILEPGVCAYVNAWRWHSDNLHLELCVCLCHAYPHLETCVLMSMLGGGTTTISMYS